MNDIQFATGWTELLLAWPVSIFRVFLIIGWTGNFKKVRVFLHTKHYAVYYDRAKKFKNNEACPGPHVTRSGILVQRRSGIVIGSVPSIYVLFANCDRHINHMYWPLDILVNHHSTTSSRLRTLVQLAVLVSVNTWQSMSMLGFRRWESHRSLIFNMWPTLVEWEGLGLETCWRKLITPSASHDIYRTPWTMATYTLFFPTLVTLFVSANHTHSLTNGTMTPIGYRLSFRCHLVEIVHFISNE